MVRPTSIELKIDAKDAAQILEALHLRMSVLPVRIDGPAGENEFGSWVDFGRCSWLSNYVTNKLSMAIADGCGVVPASRAYWRRVDRAKSLVMRFVWPFKRKEVA